ncbi:MAG: PQQ-binding-like beta-propeller repeat protein [Tepidisphaerales bacterium]
MNHALRLWSLVACACSAVASPSVLAAGPVSGFRGDGTGLYPDTDPPAAWSRSSAAVRGLRFLSHKPPAAESGSPMADGVVREWLVLGPVPIAGHDKDQDVLPDEAGLTPDEGRTTAGRRWQKMACDTAYIDFARLIGKHSDTVAYAFTNIYAPAAGTFRLDITCVGDVRVYVNGRKSPPIGPRFKLDLAKGWNRLLIRAAAGENDWYIVPVLHGWGPCEYQDTGIAWRTPLPGVHPGFYGGGTGAGAPVIVGDNLYLLSEPHDLICINKADGKLRWIRRSSFFESATDEDKKHPAWPKAQTLAGKLDVLNAAVVSGTATPAQLEEKSQLERDLQKQMRLIDGTKYASGTVPDVGFSGYTPCTDGQFIYAWFGNGVSVCYALDGSRRWIRVDQRAIVEHGFSSSPLLVDGKFVVYMRELMAFDATTGKTAWQIRVTEEDGLNPGGFFHASLVGASIGGVPVIVLGNGTIVRAGDGKVVGADPKITGPAVATPVISGKRLFRIGSGNMELITQTLPDALADPLRLPERRLVVDTTAFPKHYLPWHLSSPIIHDGLAYLINNAGVLTVVDVDAGQVVYQKLLDLDAFQAHNEGAARGLGVSPVLAGKYLYFLGNSGTALVLQPGRVYRQVARNKIENIVMAGHWSERQERFVANPVAEGKRLYVRGEGNLYAIGTR